MGFPHYEIVCPKIQLEYLFMEYRFRTMAADSKLKELLKELHVLIHDIQVSYRWPVESRESLRHPGNPWGIPGHIMNINC